MNHLKTWWSANLILAATAATLAGEPAAPAAPATEHTTGAACACSVCHPDLTMSPTAEYLVTKDRLTPNETILWPGFLTGLRGFEHVYDPIGQPIYFESATNDTNLRLLYIHHEFPDKNVISGGHLDVAAAQVRVALTERLGLIATKDGYSWLDADALPEGEGWNDLALGLKYVIYADKELDLLITPGIRYQGGNGDAEVLQGNSQEFSPFISVAKGFGDLHLMANLTYRIALDSDRGNDVFQWDLHMDYEVFRGIAPCIEVHGLTYLTDGELAPFKVGGLDYANLGSTSVAGDTVVWMGVGGRVKLTPNISVGSTYEFTLTNVNEDIMDNRVTVDVTFTW